MKAWLLDEMRGLDAMRLADTPDPQPSPDEAVLQVYYAALNPADRYLSEGLYPAKPAMPHILGRDGVGTVIATGPAATGLRVGDKRLVLRGETGVNRRGTFAQLVAVSADSLAPVPSGWSDQQAACGSLVYLTAHQALTMWGPLEGAVVLISGASGGVGVAAIQLALALGHRPIALSRSARKRDQLLKLGAVAAFDPADRNWRSDLKDLLAPRRVDLAIDNIGGTLFPELIDTLGEHGKVSIVGRLAGPVPEFNTSSLLFRRIRIGGVAVGAYTAAEASATWTQIVRLLDQTNARPLVDSIFPFDQLPQAFARLAEGPMGKVLLAI